MYKILLYSILFILSAFSCKNSQSIELKKASELLSQDSITQFKYNIIRYTGKLPGKADHTTKFDSVFDPHYINLAAQHDLVYYVNDHKENKIKFLLTRIAPSIHEKKVAIGGQVQFDEFGKLIYYEEVFRTWKMLIPELEEKSTMLFKLYLENKDLSPYYTENSKGIEYIEFPNEHVRFDTSKRLWVSDLEDPLEPYYDLKR